MRSRAPRDSTCPWRYRLVRFRRTCFRLVPVAISCLALVPLVPTHAQGTARSTTASVTLTVTVPPRATIEHVGPSVRVARDGAGDEYHAALHVRANTTWTLFARAVGAGERPASVLAADGTPRALAHAVVVPIARGGPGLATVIARVFPAAPDAPNVEFFVARTTASRATPVR
jgi:hypothetical protein